MVSSNALSTFKIKKLNLTTILMQTGYLTIKKMVKSNGRYIDIL
jgi:hypothetical protein